MPDVTTTEAAWRRRYRAARVSLPAWARDAPERLLYAANTGGKWELWLWDQLSDTHHRATDRPEGTVHGQLDPAGGELWWFDDTRGDELGRWVAEPFNREGEGAGQRRTIAPELPAAYSAGLELGRSLAVLGSSTDDGSSIHLLRCDEAAQLLYSHREAAWVSSLSRDETLLCIGHSEHGDSRHPAVRVFDLRRSDSGQPNQGKAVAELWDGAGLGLWAGEWSPVPGDQRLIVSHERRNLHRPEIWSPLTGEILDLAIDLPGEVDAGWYPDGSALLIAHDYRGRVDLYRFDLASRTLGRIETEPGTIGGAAVRLDGEIWYAWTRSSTPPEIRAGSQAAAAGPPIDAGSRVLLRPPGEPAPGGVAYTDHDACEIHFFLAEPQGPRPHPTLFEVHGGPAAHDRDAFSPLVQAWVDHGFAVALVNYRGSTGYGKAWTDAIEGKPGLTELEDIAAVYDRLVADGVADPKRTVLAGGSWGGYLTLLGLGTQPERWALGIAAVPVADYVAAFEDEMEPLKDFDRALFGGSPEELPELYRERSPITYVEQVRVPVQILAGENDPRCPIRQIDNYIARLAGLGKPHEVYRFDAGHGSLVIEEAIRQTEAQIDFAARHLGTPSPL